MRLSWFGLGRAVVIEPCFVEGRGVVSVGTMGPLIPGPASVDLEGIETSKPG